MRIIQNIISKELWCSLSWHTRVVLWLALEATVFRLKCGRVDTVIRKKLSTILEQMPVGMAAMQAGMMFTGLAIAPDNAPPIWMAINYVLSCYLAALVFVIMRRRKFAYGR